MLHAQYNLSVAYFLRLAIQDTITIPCSRMHLYLGDIDSVIRFTRQNVLMAVWGRVY